MSNSVDMIAKKLNIVYIPVETAVRKKSNLMLYCPKKNLQFSYETIP